MKKTTTEAEIRRMAAAGMSWVEIGKETGIHASRICITANVLGIASTKRDFTERDARLAGYVTRMQAGEDLSQIAMDEGRSYMSVYRSLKLAGMPTSTNAALRLLLK